MNSPHRKKAGTPSGEGFLSPRSLASELDRQTGCRFIPKRDAVSMDVVRHVITAANGGAGRLGGKENPKDKVGVGLGAGVADEFRRRMRGALLSIDTELTSDASANSDAASSSTPSTPTSTTNSENDHNSSNTRLLSFNATPSTPTRASHVDPHCHDNIHVLSKPSLGYDPVSMSAGKVKVGRHIPSAPSRILDAPELVDDYYLNLISWGADNVLAVALGQCVYLWNASNGKIVHLLTLDGQDDYVTSVNWAQGQGCSHYVAVGTNNASVQLWDTKTVKLVRTMNGHTQRVGSLAWNKHWLTSGGRDSAIIQHDVRAANHRCATFIGHTQEVCGLRWNDDGTQLASGGNENYLCLWDAAMSQRRSGAGDLTSVAPRAILTQHRAAVKALDWCPHHRGLLASGGGTADRTIKFWNTNSGALLNSIDTGSQVCSLLWSKHNKEICSSHGFSENQLCLWSYPTMNKITELKGHTARVLHMAQSPDGSTVVSAAADETLRFWNVFGNPPSSKKSSAVLGGVVGGFMGGIR